MTSQWRHRHKTHSCYSELNSLRNVYFGFLIFGKLTEWCCFVTYLSNDPRTRAWQTDRPLTNTSEHSVQERCCTKLHYINSHSRTTSRVTLWAYPTCVQDKNSAQRLLQHWWFQLHDIPHLAIELFLLLLLSCGTALPGDITSATSLSTFRHKLKTFLFCRSYGAWLFWTLFVFVLAFYFLGFFNFLVFLRVFIVLSRVLEVQFALIPR